MYLNMVVSHFLHKEILSWDWKGMKKEYDTTREKPGGAGSPAPTPALYPVDLPCSLPPSHLCLQSSSSFRALEN